MSKVVQLRHHDPRRELCALRREFEGAHDNLRKRFNAFKKMKAICRTFQIAWSAVYRWIRAFVRRLEDRRQEAVRQRLNMYYALSYAERPKLLH